MFQFDEEKYYSMPAFFGGVPVRIKISFERCRNVSLTFQTDEKLLSRYLPEGFELLEPKLIFSSSRCGEGSWLKGEVVKIFSVSAPVRYVGNDEGLVGLLPLSMWQNCTPAILTVREEAGLPGLYARIVCEEEGEMSKTFLGESEHPFASMQASLGEELGAEELESLNAASPVRQFGWRYIPNVGAPGAALSHATVCPFRFVATGGRRCEGGLSWKSEAFANYLGQRHVLKALSSLPLGDFVSGIASVGALYLKPELSRPLP